MDAKVLTSERKNISELDKLEKYLDDHGIQYSRYDVQDVWNSDGMVMTMDRHQICVGEKDNGTWDWDVICQRGSYGYKEGLLEGLGSIFQETEGFLTADDVIKRLEDCNAK